MDSVANLPGMMKFGGGTLAASGALYWLYSLAGDWLVILIVVTGLVLLVLGFVAWGYYRRRRAKRKLGSILSGAQSSAVDSEAGSNVQAIRAEFYEGLKTFLTKAKNPESKPWYLVVGESSSGKTQAILNSQIRFIQKSAVGGLGGTMGMKWWFTQDAVILDTAGRLMLPPGQNQSSLAWREFLQILKKERNNCPINGLFLMISAQSLLEYSSETINDVAGVIATRFEEVQDELGVRFPVYVFITKCDLIMGFNEFFEDLSDPRLQNQMLGWSNPADLDDDFDPKLVEEHLENIKQRLVLRRAKLLLNPPASPDPYAKRLDQIDALFNLPESLTQIGSRLRLYLETIFGGSADEKHLFLRGIYFTCAIQSGAPIDAELAAALGVPTNQLPKERAMNKVRSFFLRDVYTEKAFREKGLVTRADNVSAEKVRKRAMIVGSAIIVVAILTGVTWIGASQFNERILEHKSYFTWLNLPGNLDKTDQFKNMQMISASGKHQTAELEDAEKQPPDKMPLAKILGKSQLLASKKISPPWILTPMAWVYPDLNKQVREAHRYMLESLLLRPLVISTRATMNALPAAQWNATDTAALIELIHLEQAGLHPGDSSTPKTVALDSLMQFVLSPADYASTGQDGKDLNKITTWTYDPGSTGGRAHWPPDSLEIGSPVAMDTIKAGVTRCIDYTNAGWKKDSDNISGAFNIRDAFLKLQNAEEKFGKGEEPNTDTDISDSSAKWTALAGDVVDAGATLDGLVGKLDPHAASLDVVYQQAIGDRQKHAHAALDLIVKEIPDNSSPQLLSIRDLAKTRLDGWDKVMTDPTTIGDETQLKALSDAYFAPDDIGTDGSTQRRFDVQCQLVRQTLERSKPVTDLAASADNSALSVQLSSLDKSVATFRRELPDVREENKKDDQLQKLGQQCSSYISKVIAPRDRANLLGVALEKMPSNAQDWKKASSAYDSNLSPDHPAEGGSEPTVPLSNMNGGAYNRDFQPAFVKSTGQQFAAINALLPDDSQSTDKAILGTAELRERVRLREAAWLQYCKLYTAYWSTDVLQGLRINSAVTELGWRDFKAKLDELSVDQTHYELLALGKQMDDALRVLDVTTLKKTAPNSDPGSIFEKLSEGKDQIASGSMFAGACETRRQNWVRLPSNAMTARQKLLRPHASMDDYYLKRDHPTIAEAYWAGVYDAAITSIAIQCRTDAEKLHDEMSKYHRFPLIAQKDNEQPELSDKDLQFLRDRSKQLLISTKVVKTDEDDSPDDATPVSKGSDLLHPLREIEDVGHELAWLVDIKPLLDAMPDPDKQITFKIQLISASGEASGQCTTFTVLQDGAPVLADNVRHPTADKTGTLTMPGGAVVVQIGNLGGPPLKEWKFPKKPSVSSPPRWSPLRLLIDTDDNEVRVRKMSNADQNEWEVTLKGKVNVNGGKQGDGTVLLHVMQEDRRAGHDGDAVLPSGDFWSKISKIEAGSNPEKE